jgi:hypothetical protein
MPRLFAVIAAFLSVAPLAGQTETKSALESDPTGWIDLLAGKDLKSWKRVSIPPKSALAEKNCWSLKPDGTLHCDGIGIHEMLLYDKEFTNGIFHVEWRFEKVDGKSGYNSGVYVRNSADGDLWHQAQVGSGNVGYFFGNTLVDGKPMRAKSVSKVPQRGKVAGEWNTYEITCMDKNLRLWINGAVTSEWTCEVPRGYIGLEAERWVIEFRNVKFKELK